MRNNLRAFDPLVTRALGIYVYALVDPTTRRIFYVGKGGGDIDGSGNSRLFSHFDEADRSGSSMPSKKVKTIRSIWRQGKDVEWQILRYCLSSPGEAFHVEAAIIDALALSQNERPDNDIDGHGKGEHGWRSADEILALGAANVDPHKSGVVFVFPIHKALKNRLAEGQAWDEAVLNATRKAWVLGEGLRQLPNARAVGLVDGVSFGAYAIDEWSEKARATAKVNNGNAGEGRTIRFWGFSRGKESPGVAELRRRNWQHILSPEAKYRMRSDGVLVVEFDGQGRVRYLRPRRDGWKRYSV